MNEASDTLLPCPFCGGGGFWQSEHDSDGFGVFWAIRCADCGSCTQQHYVSHGSDCPEFRAEVRASWNARAAVPAVQPQEPVAWMCTRRLTGDKMVFSEPCVTGNPAYVKAHPHHDWQPLYAAPQAEARQEQPKQPDSVHLTSSSGEAATARDAARYRWLRDPGNVGASDAVARFGEEDLDAAIDAALSSTPAQGDASGVKGPDHG